MTILITGTEGFVGSHLAEYLLAGHPHYTVHGTYRPKASLDNLQHIQDRLVLHPVDITDSPSVYQFLETIRPDYIFHLAAQSYVRNSWESPQDTLATNILGQTNFLEALRLLKSNNYNPIFVIAGSSEEYGHVGIDDLPITEDTPLQPLSPYAISKIGQDLLGYQYYQTYGLHTVRLRIFNHTGPRRGIAFGDSALAHTIALIERGAAEPEITYRDLAAVRDFTDVRDIARAYVLAAQHCQPGEVYNVCTGRGTSIQQIYDTLLSLATVKGIRLVPDPAGARPTDGGTVIGDNSRFTRATAWQPRISFLKQTLPDLLHWWRSQLNVHEVIHPHTRIQ